MQDQLHDVREIYSCHCGFAAVVSEFRSVVTWGVADCSEVPEQLHGVREISGTYSAFAAILDGGTVATWGDARCGGDSGVQDQLRGVRLVQASLGAFAALLEDGSMVTWGMLSMVLIAAKCNSN